MAEKKKAGAFDIRVVIAALIGIYGVVLTILGVIADPQARWTRPTGSTSTCGAASAMLVFARLVRALGAAAADRRTGRARTPLPSRHVRLTNIGVRADPAARAPMFLGSKYPIRRNFEMTITQSRPDLSALATAVRRRRASCW